jgi:peroxiredoxin Q/BCP
MPRRKETVVRSSLDESRCDRLFELYIERLEPREGALAIRPAAEDPGGVTLGGVSQACLDGLRGRPEWHHLPTRADELIERQIRSIYRSEFFDRPRIGALDQIPGLAEAAPMLPEQIFDAGVHHGTTTAGRWLQRALDRRLGTDLRTRRGDGSIDYDGVIGPRTRQAVAEAVQRGAAGDVNDDVVDRRIALMRRLPHFPANPGWIARAESFRLKRTLLTSRIDLPRSQPLDGAQGQRERAMVQVGDKAPDFSMTTSGNGKIDLKGLRGRRVVLYFYPKDDTQGCTKEACGFRDSLPRFKKVDAEIIGVSRDSVARHDKFKAKYELPFTLASDEDGKVCEAYGVWVEKSNYGKKYMGIERSTFLIDEKGVVRNVWRKVKVDGHVEDVLEATRAL